MTLALLPFSNRARRAYVASAVLAGLAAHRRKRPDLDPVRFIALRTLDDLAYGLGLWRGAIAARSPDALIPLVGRGIRPRRGDAEARPERPG